MNPCDSTKSEDRIVVRETDTQVSLRRMNNGEIG